MPEMSLDLQFLFPFEKVPAGSSVLIYGAARMGQAYLHQVEMTGFCQVAGFVDRNYRKYAGAKVRVYAPEQISSLCFDYVVLALQNPAFVPEVLHNLEEQGVDRGRIVCLGARQVEKWHFLYEGWEVSSLSEIAPDADIHLAFRLYSAIGSMLFLKWFIAHLVEWLPECAIDLYLGGLEGEARFLFSDIVQIRRFISDFGGRYEANTHNYEIAMRLHGAGLVIVDQVAWEAFPAGYNEFLSKLRSFVARTRTESLQITMPRSAIFQLRKFQGRNAYTAMGYGVFGDDSKTVSIPCKEEGRAKFRNLGLRRYATINFGNGSSKDSSIVAKTWSLDRFEAVVAGLRKIHPEMTLVQLGAADAKKIHGVHRYVLGEDMPVVMEVLRHSAFHLDIEGGLVHFATQLGTKCIVLFGPTPEFYYGYKENINIKAGTCHDCCGVCLNHNCCAREMAEPECMYSITPEMVLDRIALAWTELTESR